MILEGILTTVNADGEVNISPLGPQVDASAGRFVLRPFKGGRSYENLLRTREAVFHVVDDVELLRDFFGMDQYGNVPGAPARVGV